MTKEDLNLLKEVNNILNPSNFVNAVYMEPAQVLRNQADELERTDIIKRKFQEFIDKQELITN